MMKRLLLTAALLAAPLQAAELNGTHAACVSADALDQLITAVNNVDDAWFFSMFEGGQCIIPLEGTKATVVSHSWGVVKVRVGTGGGLFLFLPVEELKL